MYISNYLATNIRLVLLLLIAFLLASCAQPTGTGTGPTATNTGEVASPTADSNDEIVNAAATNPTHFSYIVNVSDKSTNEPIQGAEVSIRIGKDLSEPTVTDVRGRVVFTLKIDQADQQGQLIVKAEGYKEETFNIAPRVNNPPEEVQLLSLATPPAPDETFTPTTTETSTPTSQPSTETPTPTETPSPPPPPSPETPTSTPTETRTPTPTKSPTPGPTATPAIPSGNLAIPVIFNFDTKVYLTGFDGAGINGPNEISLDAQQPMFSRDGKSVMVKAIIKGVIGLYKLTASGFTPEIVIRRGSAEWPVLSPDGQTVMFSESTLDYRLHKRLPSEEIDDGIIEEMSLNGFPIFAENLLWSEDNELVFQGCAVWINEPGTCGTWITNASNLNPRRILIGNQAQPMAIKDNLLAYISREEGDWDIYIMQVDSGEVTNLTDNNFEDGLPAISPDGNMVAYISNESGQWGLWTVNLDGQNKQHWFDIDPVRGVIDIDQWSKERMSWRR